MCWLAGSRRPYSLPFCLHKNSSSIPTALHQQQQRWKSFQPFYYAFSLLFFPVGLIPFSPKPEPPLSLFFGLLLLVCRCCRQLRLSISPFDIGKRHLTFCPNNDGVYVGRKREASLFIQSAAGRVRDRTKTQQNRNNDNNMEKRKEIPVTSDSHWPFPFWRVTSNETLVCFVCLFFSSPFFSIRTNLLDQSELNNSRHSMCNCFIPLYFF